MSTLNFEKAVLCAVLEQPETLLDLVDLVLADDFAEVSHQRLWQALLSLLKEGQRPDAVRVQRLLDRGLAMEAEYIGELRNYLPSLGEFSVKGVRVWAEAVHEAGKKRRLIDSLSQVLSKAKKSDEGAEALAAQLLTRIVEQAEYQDTRGFRLLAEYEAEFEGLLQGWFQGAAIDRLPTGFKKLDEQLGGGLGKGHLLVVGGRPGTMKTAWVWLVARNVAQRLTDGGCVAFASLEMSTLDLLKRAVCAEAEVDSTHLETGKLGEKDQQRVLKAARELLSLPIKVYDGLATSDFLHYQTLMLMAQENIKLLIVDFAEMVADTGEDEEKRVSAIFKAAKEIAKVRQIPVIVLSQLNRQVEYEASRIPGLHHLRWGGAAEAVADAVLFTYYPWLYQQRGESVQPPSELGFITGDEALREENRRVNQSMWWLIVAKARYGKTGFVKFKVRPEYTLITDWPEPGGRVTVGRPRLTDF